MWQEICGAQIVLLVCDTHDNRNRIQIQSYLLLELKFPAFVIYKYFIYLVLVYHSCLF